MLELYFSVFCLTVLIMLGALTWYYISGVTKGLRAVRKSEEARSLATRLRADGRELPRAAAEILDAAAQISQYDYDINIFGAIDRLENGKRHMHHGYLSVFDEYAYELARRTLGPGDPLKDLWFAAAEQDLARRSIFSTRGD